MDAPGPGADHLYQAAPCGLLLAAPDGRILQVNDTLCAWLRREPAEMVERMRFPDLLTMGGRIFWQTHLHPLLRIQASVAEVKLELRREDRSTIPVMVNVAERPWQGQTLLHVAVFVAEDRHKYERELLLQRQRAEELAAMHARVQRELAAAQEQAEDRAGFAEHLVGMVSHDIRNPLSVIHMSAVLLERGIPPAQQQAATQRIARAVSRVQHLIADLLDFTQARLGGGISMRKSSVDLHEAVADTVAELAVAFPSSTLRYERSGGGVCHADAQRITQALGNLVANAVAHGDPASPIVVRSETRDGSFVVGVQNQGKPIPPDVIPKLFEPMVRGENAGSRGVGLGLFIVHEIVRAHEGQVEVQSNAEGGTTFRIRLPCPAQDKF